MTAYLNYEDANWQLTDEQKTFFDEMEKEVGVPITIINGNGQRMQRDKEMEGIVFFDYSTNSESPAPRRVDQIARRNATTIPLKNHFLLKEDSQREHIFDFNGFPLCEMRLLTLWGLTPLENFDTAALMKEFWKDALKMSIDQKFFKRKEEEKKKKIRDAFLRAMRAANEGEVHEQEGTLKTKSDQLAQLNSDIVACHTEILKAERRLEIAKQIIEGDNTTYEGEIASLMNHSQISHIDYDTGNGVLEIYTHLLYIYSPDKEERSPLGEFLIKVNTKNNNAVTLHNLTNQRSSKMHPHVESNGAACWGAIGTQIARLAASCRIEGLTDLVIRYLESYNVQDANAGYAQYWFTAKDTEKRRDNFENQWMNEATYKEAVKAKKEMEKKGKAEIKADGEKKEVQEPEKITDKDLEKAAN